MRERRAGGAAYRVTPRLHWRTASSSACLTSDVVLVSWTARLWTLRHPRSADRPSCSPLCERAHCAEVSPRFLLLELPAEQYSPRGHLLRRGRERFRAPVPSTRQAPPERQSRRRHQETTAPVGAPSPR